MIGICSATTPSPGEVPPAGSRRCRRSRARRGSAARARGSGHGRLVERDDDHVAAARARELAAEELGVGQELRGIVVAPLDLDVDRRVRERAHDLGERRHAEVARLEAARRAAVAAADAAQRVAPRRQALDRVAAGDEVERRVEPLHLGEREVGQVARALGRAVDGPVVHHDELAVGGPAHVELEHVRAGRDRAPERVQRVRRQLRLAALVGDVEDAVVEPRVGRGAAGAASASAATSGDQDGGCTGHGPRAYRCRASSATGRAASSTAARTGAPCAAAPPPTAPGAPR